MGGIFGNTVVKTDYVTKIRPHTLVYYYYRHITSDMWSYQKRHHELLLIDRRQSKLDEWRKRLEQMQYDLTAREARILESEPFLTVAKKLQEMKLALEDALPWIETINEVAQTHKMDLRTSAIFVGQELKLNRQFGGIQRQIEIAQGQLKMLNTISAQKERGLSILAALQNKGVSTDAIYGFSEILDLERMGREWNPLQGNGSSMAYQVDPTSIE
jgi:hypothetical protein